MTKGRLRSILVVAGILLALASMVGVAFADGSAPNKKPIVHGKQLNKPGPGPVVHGVTLHQQAGNLPFTGADVVLFLGIALVLISAGLLIYRRTRPSRVSA
jgi:hypothetical protein